MLSGTALNPSLSDIEVCKMQKTPAESEVLDCYDNTTSLILDEPQSPVVRYTIHKNPSKKFFYEDHKIPLRKYEIF